MKIKIKQIFEEDAYYDVREQIEGKTGEWEGSQIHGFERSKDKRFAGAVTLDTPANIDGSKHIFLHFYDFLPQEIV